MSRIILLGFIISFHTDNFSQSNFKEKFTVLFEKDVDTLNEKEKSKLKSFLFEYKDFFLQSIVITGHTDGDGSDTYNNSLSERRSNHVLNIINGNNIHTDFLKSNSFGEKRLLLKENSEKEKSQNRRVELELNLIKANSIQDIIKGIQPDFNQIYSYDSKIEIIQLRGKRGTEIKLNRKDLIYEDGSPLLVDDRIDIKLVEIQSFLDQIQANISTETLDGKILESGGMFNISVESNGKKLKLKDGKSYLASLPNKYKTDKMSVFNGRVDEMGVMKWQITEQDFLNSVDNIISSPPIQFNIKTLDSWDLRPKLSRYLRQKNYSIKIPIPPNKPYLPCEPRKPHINQNQYQPNFFQTILNDSVGEEKIRQKKFQYDYDTYLVRLEKFRKRYTKKNLEMQDYYKKLSKYNEEVSYCLNYIDSVYKDLLNYKLAWMERSYIENLKSKKAQIIDLSSKDRLFETNLKKLLQARNEIIQFVPDAYYKSVNQLMSDYVKEFYEVRNPKLVRRRTFAGCSEEVYVSNKLFYEMLSSLRSVSVDSAANYLEKLTNNYVKRDIVPIINSSNYSTNYFTASLTSFNWINCDRFYKTPPNMMANYIIDFNDSINVDSVKSIITFPSINSCIQIFGTVASVPKKIEARITSYYLDKHKSIQYATSDLNYDKGTYIHLQYQSITLDEFKKKLANLNL